MSDSQLPAPLKAPINPLENKGAAAQERILNRMKAQEERMNNRKLRKSLTPLLSQEEFIAKFKAGLLLVPEIDLANYYFTQNNGNITLNTMTITTNNDTIGTLTATNASLVAANLDLSFNNDTIALIIIEILDPIQIGVLTVQITQNNGIISANDAAIIVNNGLITGLTAQNATLAATNSTLAGYNTLITTDIIPSINANTPPTLPSIGYLTGVATDNTVQITANSATITVNDGLKTDLDTQNTNLTNQNTTLSTNNGLISNIIAGTP